VPGTKVRFALDKRLKGGYFMRWSRVVLALLLAILFFASGNVRTYWKKRQYLKKVEENLAQIRSQNQKLALEIKRIHTDPQIIEQTTRKELGLIQSGEIEYRFVRHSNP
jgi:cell division protein FtsB